MKAHISILLALALLIGAGQAGASFWFKVVDISPSPIIVSPGGSANFTVLVKGLGSERAYVELVFKNKTEGLDFYCPKMIKNVYPAGVSDYSCSVQAASDMAAGNYSFVVDVAAKGAPSGKMTGYIVVPGASGAEAAEEMEETSANAGSEPSTGKAVVESSENGTEGSSSEAATEQPQAPEKPKETPSPGALAAILGLMLASGIITSGRKNS